jgi:hypothetical protein
MSDNQTLHITRPSGCWTEIVVYRPDFEGNITLEIEYDGNTNPVYLSKTDVQQLIEMLQWTLHE